MKLEFLVLVTNNDYFCDSKKAFIDFLKLDSLITISGKSLTFKKTPKSKPLITVKFDVETKNIPSNKERYFIIALENKNDELVDEFFEVGEKIKELSGRINPNSTIVNILWDDIGRHYAHKSYPLINDVENVMRKLISKFMLINVGMDWSKEAIHPDLVSKIERFEENDVHLNDLYKLDFIHLSDVLFKKKRDINLDELDRVLAKKEFTEDDKNKILKFLPKSNWEKYFSELLGEKSQNLEKKWEILYKLRNKVAHNRFLTREDFEKIKGITSQVKETLIIAINKLGEINLDEEDRNLIIDSYQSGHIASLAYKSEKLIIDYYNKNGFQIETPAPGRDSFTTDFIINDNNKRTAVEVKYSPASSSIRMFMNKIIKAIYQVNTCLTQTSIDNGKVIIVTSGIINETQKIQIKQELDLIRLKLDPKISIEFGFITENDEFHFLDL